MKYLYFVRVTGLESRVVLETRLWRKNCESVMRWAERRIWELGISGENYAVEIRREEAWDL